jgi:hypothetical protein
MEYIEIKVVGAVSHLAVNRVAYMAILVLKPSYMLNLGIMAPGLNRSPDGLLRPSHA